MWFICNRYQAFLFMVLLASYNKTRCNAISNTNFNDHIRDYAADAISINNVTGIKTLQKELGRSANFAPVGNPIKFKEIPDSALSSTNNGHGLYHEQPGYSLNDYEESPHYSYGHDYPFHDPHPDVYSHHGHDHHSPPEYGHHPYAGHHGHGHGHGHYNKHYKHALAAKAILWPIAGVALLGAAAALVSNPVLLQLGVLSSKRRRRNTEEINQQFFSTNGISYFDDQIKKLHEDDKEDQFSVNIKKLKQTKDEKVNDGNELFRKRLFKPDSHKEDEIHFGRRKTRSSIKRNVNQVTTSLGHDNTINDDGRFIPIPIKLRPPKS